MIKSFIVSCHKKGNYTTSTNKTESHSCFLFNLLENTEKVNRTKEKVQWMFLQISTDMRISEVDNLK